MRRQIAKNNDFFGPQKSGRLGSNGNNRRGISNIDANQDKITLFNYFVTLIVFAFILTGFTAIVQYFLWDNIDKNQRLDALRIKSEPILKVLEIYEQVANKAMPEGYAPLDSNTLIPFENLPIDGLIDTIYLGCWDAATNTPTLVSGLGEQFLLYSVCTGGMTILDAVGDWLPFDFAYYIGGSFGWFQFQGRRNRLEDSGPILPGELSFIRQDQGSVMELNSISTIDPNIELFQTSTNIEISYTQPEVPFIQLRDFGFPNQLGESLIAVANSTNGNNVSEIKNLAGDGALDVISTSDSIIIDISSPNIKVQAELITLELIIDSDTRPDTVYPSVLFSAVDVGNNFIRLSSLNLIEYQNTWSVTETLILRLNLADPTNSPFLLNRLPTNNPGAFTISVVGNEDGTEGALASFVGGGATPFIISNQLGITLIRTQFTLGNLNYVFSVDIFYKYA